LSPAITPPAERAAAVQELLIRHLPREAVPVAACMVRAVAEPTTFPTSSPDMMVDLAVLVVVVAAALAASAAKAAAPAAMVAVSADSAARVRLAPPLHWAVKVVGSAAVAVAVAIPTSLPSPVALEDLAVAVVVVLAFAPNRNVR